MSQPVLSDAEVKGVGEGRWHAKNGKRFWVLIIAVLLIGYGVVELAQRVPHNSPLGLVLAIAIAVGFFFAYRQWIILPARKAGEDFLKERPLTIFAKDKE